MQIDDSMTHECNHLLSMWAFEEGIIALYFYCVLFIVNCHLVKMQIRHIWSITKEQRERERLNNRGNSEFEKE